VILVFKKLMLCRKINKFYKIFGEVIGCPNFHYGVRELTDDNLMGIGFDIMEALEGSDEVHDPMNAWLNKLYIQTIF
jgi:hypothetical protein